jgi:hypothetical protein
MFLLVSVAPGGDVPVVIAQWPRLDWGRGREVRLMRDPTDEQLASVLALLTRGQVFSAALLQALPTADRQWLAYEFPRKLVTDRDIDERRLEALGWRPARDEFTVWTPRRPADEKRAEFATGILQPTPRFVEVPVYQDLDDASLFGPFAASQRGGSCALMALSGAQSGHESVLLRNPAALELDVITDSESLPLLVERGAVSVWAVGASSHTDGSELDLEGFTDPGAVRRAWDSTGRSGGFWLAIQLAAPVDPPVGIPPGHIFEQRSLNGVQTLAAATSSFAIVNPGAPVTMVVPAWCLNRELQGPNGQQVRPTVLRGRYAANTPQDQVWADRRRVLSNGQS